MTDVDCMACLERAPRHPRTINIVATVDGVTHHVARAIYRDFALFRLCDYDEELNDAKVRPGASMVDAKACVALSYRGQRAIDYAVSRWP